MNLPTSREYTVSGATPVTSALLNALQDCIIGAKHPAITDWRMPAWIYQSGTWTWTPGPGAYYQTAGAGPPVGVCAINSRVGDRITNLIVNAYGDGSVDCTYQLLVLDASQNKTDLIAAGPSDVNRAAAWGQFSPTTVTPHVMAAGESLIVVVSPNNVNYRVGSIGITRDRL